MPIIVESSRANADLFTSVTGTNSEVVGNLEELKRLLSESPDEHAIVIGPGVDLEAAAALADTLRVTRPSVSVILIRRRVDTSVLAEALRSGMREVVDERDLTGLGSAVMRALQVWQALSGSGASTTEADRGRVISVFSPKGGVGKTTLAVNMALALSQRGAHKVCIVDLDLAFGDVAITLQLVPDHTITEAIGLEDHLDFALLETLLTRHEASLTILAAPTRPDIKDKLPPSLVRSVLRTLREHFDFILVDTSPAFDDHVLQAFDETDECILVATLDVPTIKNVKMALDTLNALGLVPQNRRLVLNRADDEVGLSAKNVESILGMPVGTALPTAVAVANATNHGRPIVLSKPEHPVSKAFRSLAADYIPAAPADASGPEPASKRGLFGRKK